MKEIIYTDDSYESHPGLVSSFLKVIPSAGFYFKLFTIVFRSSRMAKYSVYDTSDWAKSSLDVMRALESVGVKIDISGVDYFRGLNTPCVFLANHMSSLETFVLPAIIGQFRDVTFVVKKSLIDYPVFRYVMRSRDPITVGRTNPREDLKAVLEGGAERLRAGRSVVIFPQTTRMAVFDPKGFNTIGIKLARKAEVPVVPIALKTDAWGNGRYLKDFGKIDPSRRVRIAFGKPIRIRERGTEEHREVIEFMGSKLKEWDA